MVTRHLHFTTGGLRHPVTRPRVVTESGQPPWTSHLVARLRRAGPGILGIWPGSAGKRSGLGLEQVVQVQHALGQAACGGLALSLRAPEKELSRQTAAASDDRGHVRLFHVYCWTDRGRRTAPTPTDSPSPIPSRAPQTLAPRSSSVPSITQLSSVHSALPSRSPPLPHRLSHGLHSRRYRGMFWYLAYRLASWLQRLTGDLLPDCPP